MLVGFGLWVLSFRNSRLDVVMKHKDYMKLMKTPFEELCPNCFLSHNGHMPSSERFYK